MNIIKFLSKIPSYLSKIFEKLYLDKYSKTFSNYEDAKRFCDSISPNSYENHDLNLFRYEKFIKNLDLVPIIYNNSHKLLLETLLIYNKSEKTIPKILDVGGGFGENKIYLKHLLNEDLVYDIIESNKVVSLSKSKNLTHSKFFTDISFTTKNNKYDIIFSSGTIQYFEKPYEIIEEIFSSKTKFISFTRINFSNNPKIYSQPTLIEYHGAREGSLDFKYQKSKKIIIPNTQINENEMLKISKKHNYKLLKKGRGIEGNVGEDSYALDLIFKLNK